MKITREQGRDLAFDNLNGWKRTQDRLIDQRRWVTTHEGIFQHAESGRHYRLLYDIGSTECQDDYTPFEYDDPVLVEVELREVVRSEWVEV